MEAALEQEPNLSSQTKEALSTLVSALRDQSSSAPAVAAQSGSAAGSSFLDRVHPFADMRLRHEWDGRPNQENRNRERVRLRVGATAELGSGWWAGFRFRTGDPEDARSPYHDLGSDEREMFGSLELNIDRAYVTYRPSFLEGSWITAGKFAHPFVSNPVFGELVWDADVNPDGISGGFRFMPTEGLDLELVAGEYLPFSNDNGDEFSAFVTQGSAKLKAREDLSLLAALGWYRYSDPQPDDETFAQDDFQQSTNFWGHVFGLRYGLTDRIGMRTWGLVSKPADGGSQGTRLRVDLDAKF